MQNDLILIQKTELLNMIDEVLENKFKTYFELLIQNQSPQSTTNESLLSIEEVQKQLKICRNKIFVLIKSGELKSVKIDRRRLVTQEAVNNFIKEKSEQ
jgi:excisionase family DNA binding protein